MKQQKPKHIKGAKINREYSWIKFNERVLALAEDQQTPLLERCKFLSIFAGNFDEFFMVRVGSLQSQLDQHERDCDKLTGMTTKEQLDMIFKCARKLNDRRAKVFSALKRALKQQKISFLTHKNLPEKHLSEVQDIYRGRILPFLSPSVIDSKHPLRSFDNLSSYIIFELEREKRKFFGLVPVPAKLNKLYTIGKSGGKFILLEDILKICASSIFEGYVVCSATGVRVTRNADINTKEESMLDESSDFSKFIKTQIDLRSKMTPIRLEMCGNNERIKSFLIKTLKLNEQQVFEVHDYFDYKFFFVLGRYLDKQLVERLSYPPLVQNKTKVNEGQSVLRTLEKEEMFCFYPYDSMDTFVKLLEECATAKEVRTIKITIYRLAKDSKVVEALARASQNGKEVTVVIELCARFDEESNLYFADLLRDAGCNIVYGMGDFKVHSKIASVVLSTKSGVRYITHFGTGNYNESTAKQYTDINILTTNEQLGKDVVDFFKNLAIFNIEHVYSHLWVAPKTLRSNIIASIDNEICHAKNGEPAEISAKLNSLSEEEVIDKLVEASKAGVKIKLNVRGICSLLPGIKGKSENIEVVSVVGRFLEHARIYSFGCEGRRKTYIGSADFMHRNLSRRVEVAVPVLCPKTEQKVFAILQSAFLDNKNAHRLLSNGIYQKIEPKEGEEVFDSQACFFE